MTCCCSLAYVSTDNAQSIVRTFEDVERLVAESVPEGLRLEYKSGYPVNKDRFKNDIAQDISAFANSAGGTLVIGVTEQSSRPFGIDGVDTHFSRESLGQVLAYKISPSIPGLHVACLSSQTKTVLVVYTPASRDAPHQGPNHTYYRRYEHHNQPMAHHEIEDLRRRQISISPLVIVSTATRGSILAAIDIQNPGEHPGLDLSIYTLRNIQKILGGHSIEKLPPKWFAASGFQVALGIPIDVAFDLERLFRGDDIVNREQLSSIRGMTAEFLERFDLTFDLRSDSAESQPKPDLSQ